jgi:hypothetical protein
LLPEPSHNRNSRCKRWRMTGRPHSIGGMPPRSRRQNIEQFWKKATEGLGDGGFEVTNVETLVGRGQVTVSEGGQAIVGNVSHGGKGPPQKVETNLMKREYAFQKAAPLLGYLETDKGAMQGSRDARMESLPIPRSARWSAEGQGQRLVQAWAPNPRSERERRIISDLLRKSRKTIATSKGEVSCDARH